jgi:squalene synthase HpnC
VREFLHMPLDHYENFPVASWLLPARLREAVQAIYRFARGADDVADEGSASAAERLAALAVYRQGLQSIADGSVDTHDPLWGPLAASIERHRLPLSPLHRLLDAFEQDVRNPAYADRASLLAYCTLSANPVGELMLHLYGAVSEQHLRWSDAICSGLQLANFWQDLGLDVSRQRHYLPRQELACIGLSVDDLRPGPTPPKLRALIRDLCHWADGLLLEGAPLARTLPGRIGWELRGVVLGGRRILHRVAAIDYDVLNQRPVLTGTDWLVLAGQALRYRTVSPHDP